MTDQSRAPERGASGGTPLVLEGPALAPATDPRKFAWLRQVGQAHQGHVGGFAAMVRDLKGGFGPSELLELLDEIERLRAALDTASEWMGREPHSLAEKDRFSTDRAAVNEVVGGY